MDLFACTMPYCIGASQKMRMLLVQYSPICACFCLFNNGSIFRLKYWIFRNGPFLSVSIVVSLSLLACVYVRVCARALSFFAWLLNQSQLKSTLNSR